MQEPPLANVPGKRFISIAKVPNLRNARFDKSPTSEVLLDLRGRT